MIQKVNSQISLTPKQKKVLDYVNKFTVGHTSITRRGIHPHVPQGSEISFLFLAAPKGTRPGVKQGFFRGSLFGLAAPLKTFGMAEQLFAFFVSYGSSFNSRHAKFSNLKWLSWGSQARCLFFCLGVASRIFWCGSDPWPSGGGLFSPFWSPLFFWSDFSWSSFLYSSFF
mgnify:CR=1 FL=1